MELTVHTSRCERSQPHAGDFLNAVPKHRPYQVHSWIMRAELQRRLGLPLDLVAASSALHPGLASKHGHRFDALL